MPSRVRRNLASGNLLILAGLLAGLAFLLVQKDWLWRWDQVVYDTQLQLIPRTTSNEIVIIAIDEQSLSEFGRWPWRRYLHAELLDRLTAEQPRAVALDIIFSEPDLVYPEDDHRLAESIKRNGKVVLPVLMEQSRQGAIPSESLPIAPLAEQAAAMGHVHVELDQDGFARRLFLYEGLGGAFWPHLTIATTRVAGQDNALPGTSFERKPASPGIWSREHQVLIPFTGPPGSYQRISYDQVIKGEFKPGTFRDKLVLVGVTASGLGDALPTPVSGLSHSMPGVEINANMLDAIQNGLQISQVSRNPQLFLTLLLTVSPLLLYPLLGPRNSLLLASGLIILTLALSTLVLSRFNIWFPPVPALLAIALGYPLWSWLRLERTMDFLNQELDTLQSQRAELAILRDFNPHNALSFIAQVMPVSSWVWTDENGVTIDSSGSPPHVSFREIKAAHWSETSRSWATATTQDGRQGMLEIFWSDGQSPGNKELELLDRLAQQMQTVATPQRNPADILQARIAQVRAATDELRGLRQFIDDALSFMSDGVLIADAFGDILIANERAAWYLTSNNRTQLSGNPLLETLHKIELSEGASWISLLNSVLVEGRYVHNNAKMRDGRDLLVQIAPLRVQGGTIDAHVINLSDISSLRASERKRNELLHFLSHDLRSPLVSILALLELASSKTQPGEIKPLLERIRNNSEKTLDIAEQFLHLARAESDESYTLKELDLVSVIWNAHEQAWGQARSRDIQLINEIDIDDAWVIGEGSLLERALVNLLTNAIKYSPPGTTVRTRLTREKDGFKCCVLDQGHGIDQEDIPYLFDRFRRIVKTEHQKESGAGLGLAFVDAVITRHSGTIEVESTPGSGTSFCLTLPTHKPPTDSLNAS